MHLALFDCGGAVGGGGLFGGGAGGWIVSQITGNDPMDGVFDISTLVTAVVGAVVLVILVNMMRGRSRTGSVRTRGRP